MQNIITNDEVGTTALPLAKPLLSDAVFRPMLFSTPMVQSILKGKKTETRRIIKLDYPKWDFMGFEIGNSYRKNHVAFGIKSENNVCDLIKQKFFVGDVIWGRETFALKGQRVFYKADNDNFENAGLKGLYDFVWKPSLFMPKDVCRLFLEVENVTIERLQDISEEDAINEGLETSIVKSSIFQTYLGYKNYYVQDAEDELYYRSPIDSYKSLWMSINGSQSWQENPFVWVYSFKVVECPYGFR
jgi:hypothetical protein